MSGPDGYVDDHLRSCARSASDKETVMAAIPADYLDLLQQKATFAHLATIMPDGTPQVTPVWFDYTDGKIRINSAKGRVKARNMREGAPVALSILDPDNPYRYIQIRGRVEHVTEEGASDTSIPSPRNTSGRTSTLGPNLARSGSRLKSSPPRCRPMADLSLTRGRRPRCGIARGPSDGPATSARRCAGDGFAQRRYGASRE